MAGNGMETLEDVARKICARCKEPKALEHYYRDSNQPDGKRPYCRGCIKDYNTSYLRRKRAREYSKRYYAKQKSGQGKAIILQDETLEIVLNDGMAKLSYRGPLSAQDFNILLRTIGISEKRLTGER